MVAYQAVQEEFHDHDLGVYTAFGVCAYQMTLSMSLWISR